MRKAYRTISLPSELYQRLEELVRSTGFRTPTEYLLYLLRRSLEQIDQEKEKLNQVLAKSDDKKQIAKIKTRLKRLGYLT